MTSQPVTGVVERYGRGSLWAAILVTLGWHFVSVLPVVITGWLQFGPATSGAAIWLVYLLAGLISAVVALRGGGQSPLLGLLICPVLLAGVVLGALAVRAGFFDHLNWPFSVSGWFALIALWRRRLRELIAFFVLNAVAGLCVMVSIGQTDRVSLARFIVLCCGVSFLQITLLVGSRAVTAMAGRGAGAEAAVARTRTKQIAADAVQAGRRARYQAVRETVADLLQGLATGQLDLSDPGTRQRIALAVTRLRRELVETDEVPDPLSHELRACADAAERRGIAVDLVAPAGTVPSLPVELRRALTEPVISMLAAATTQARITVVASPDEVVLAVLADATLTELPTSRHAGIELSADMEGDLPWVEARWTGPSRSRS